MTPQDPAGTPLGDAFPAAFVESRLRKPMDLVLKRRAAAEWRQRRTDRRGSEMFLFFRRGTP